MIVGCLLVLLLIAIALIGVVIAWTYAIGDRGSDRSA